MIIVQIVLSGLLGSLISFRVILKIELFSTRCDGTWPVLQVTLLVMNRLNRSESAIFISLMHSLYSRHLTIQHLFKQINCA